MARVVITSIVNLMFVLLCFSYVVRCFEEVLQMSWNSRKVVCEWWSDWIVRLVSKGNRFHWLLASVGKGADKAEDQKLDLTYSRQNGLRILVFSAP